MVTVPYANCCGSPAHRRWSRRGPQERAPLDVGGLSLVRATCAPARGEHHDVGQAVREGRGEIGRGEPDVEGPQACPRRGTRGPGAVEEVRVRGPEDDAQPYLPRDPQGRTAVSDDLGVDPCASRIVARCVVRAAKRDLHAAGKIAVGDTKALPDDARVGDEGAAARYLDHRTVWRRLGQRAVQPCRRSRCGIAEGHDARVDRRGAIARRSPPGVGRGLERGVDATTGRNRRLPSWNTANDSQNVSFISNGNPIFF